VRLRYYYDHARDLTFVDGFDGYAPEIPKWRKHCFLITGVNGVIFGRPPANLILEGNAQLDPLDWINPHRVYWEKIVRDFRKAPKPEKPPVKFAAVKVFAKLSGKSEEKVKVVLYENKTHDKER